MVYEYRVIVKSPMLDMPARLSVTSVKIENGKLNAYNLGNMVLSLSKWDSVVQVMPVLMKVEE